MEHAVNSDGGLDGKVASAQVETRAKADLDVKSITEWITSLLLAMAVSLVIILLFSRQSSERRLRRKERDQRRH